MSRVGAILANLTHSEPKSDTRVPNMTSTSTDPSTVISDQLEISNLSADQDVRFGTKVSQIDLKWGQIFDFLRSVSVIMR